MSKKKRGGSWVARLLGLEDAPIPAVEYRRRCDKEREKGGDDVGVRTHYVGKKVVYGGSKPRRRDRSLPPFCTDDFTGNVKIKGKTVRFIGGVRQ